MLGIGLGIGLANESFNGFADYRYRSSSNSFSGMY
jgi:hypothetical protein